MKKKLYFNKTFIIILVILIYNLVKPIDNMIYLKDVKINELTKYRINKENDFKNFGEISRRLPGNKSRSGEGMAWGEDVAIIELNYDYHTDDRFRSKKFDWFWKKYREEIFLFNSTAFMILVPNADKVEIQLDKPYKQTFEVTRNDLEYFYGRDLNEYYKNTSLWEKEVIKENINSSKNLRKFYETHKITETK